MFKPDMADSKCSTVETRILSLPRQVDKVVSITLLGVALISMAGVRSRRLKIMPVFIAAGRKVRVAFSPECNAIPVALMIRRKVRCLIIQLFPVLYDVRKWGCQGNLFLPHSSFVELFSYLFCCFVGFVFA